MELDGGTRTSGRSIDLEESDSIDMNTVNQMIQDINDEEKQSEIQLLTKSDEGNPALPTNTKTTTRQYESKHIQDHSHSRSRNDSHSNQDDKTSIPIKTYCIAGYQILLHLLLLYCVIGVTIYLLSSTNNADCQCTEFKASSVSSDTGITNNTGIITLNPSTSPTDNPSQIPSSNPTMKPTLQPTQHIETYIGDYKISAQNESHGGWKLCDGSFLDSEDYPELFGKHDPVRYGYVVVLDV